MSYFERSQRSETFDEFKRFDSGKQISMRSEDFDEFERFETPQAHTDDATFDIIIFKRKRKTPRGSET